MQSTPKQNPLEQRWQRYTQKPSGPHGKHMTATETAPPAPSPAATPATNTDHTHKKSTHTRRAEPTTQHTARGERREITGHRDQWRRRYKV